MKSIFLDQQKTGQQRPALLDRIETPGGGYAELSYRFDPKFVPHGTFEVWLRHKHERAKKETATAFLIEKGAVVEYDLQLQTLGGSVKAAILKLYMNAMTEDGDLHEVEIRSRRIPLA